MQDIFRAEIEKKTVFILKTDTRWQWMHVNAHILLISVPAMQIEQK